MNKASIEMVLTSPNGKVLNYTATEAYDGGTYGNGHYIHFSSEDSELELNVDCRYEIGYTFIKMVFKICNTYWGENLSQITVKLLGDECKGGL